METDMDVTTEQPLSHTDKYSLDSNVFAPADLASASTVKMDDVEAANNKHRLELISASTAKIEGIEMLEDLAAQSIQRLQLVWTDVSHIVQVKVKADRKKGIKAALVEKSVLDSVSGVANPGQLLSVMGPSGGGKTSILNVLAGRISPVRGQVLLNGQPLPPNFNRIAAYVMQDDLLSEMLTPRELFQFAANLRLAQSTPAERYSRVEYLIKTLGLSRCANNRVGKPLQRGLSGGERKRTSIGYELITNPSLIFLDEPTSGLDSFTAYAVLELLKQLASEGRTVVCTIHQPSSEIFALFDRLMLLSGGRVVFNGKANDAVPYFADQGLPCPKYSNPADFFMKILHNHSADDKARVDALVAYYRAHSPRSPGVMKQDSSALLSLELAPKGEVVVSQVSKPTKGPGSWKEIVYLSRRSFVTLVRNPITLQARIAQNIVMALVAGLLYYHLGNDQTSIQDRIGALFFIVMSQVMSSTMTVVLTFPLERNLLVREQNSGMYKIWTYYFGRTSTDLAMNVVFPLLFALVVYWFIGLANTAGQFFMFYLILWLTVNAGSSLGLVLGSALPNPEVAVSIAPIVLMPFVLFGGLFANLTTIGPWLSWLQWLSIFRYSFQAVAINELDGMVFVCTPDEYVVAGNIKICPVTSGTQVLNSLGLNDQGIWFPLVMLAALIVFFRILGVIFLWWQTIRVMKKN